MNLILDAHVDAVTALRRSALEEEGGAAGRAGTPGAPAGRKPSVIAGPKLIERSVVDLTFSSTPAAARRVLNSIAAADHQFFIIRLLHVRNEKDKGPAREGVADPAASAAGNPSLATKTPATGLNFIVGTEKLQTSARIEILRFTF